MPPGPPLGQKGAAYADVASANTTLNTLMPGRQKSWMTNTPVQPSPRRPRPPDSGTLQSRQSTAAAQQQVNAQVQSRPQPEPEIQAHPTLYQSQQAPTTPANVLPSPAPSDEPSPAALSNYKDSPNPQTVSLAAVSRGHLDPAPNSSSIPPCPDPNALSPKATGAEPTSAEYAVLGALAQAVRSPLAMAPPEVPHGNQIGPANGGANALGSSPSSPALRSRSDSIGVQEHPSKRRRVGATSTSHTFGELAAAMIDRRIAQIGGHDKLTIDVEGPRFALLKEACAKGDLFYLHLHSLYCLWSCDAQRLPPVLSRDLDVTHRGFSIIETVLKKNTGFRKDNLLWCAEFPRNTFNEDDPEGTEKVAKFLTGLSQHWPRLLPACFNRHYPYLVDELLGQLQCYSACMQHILFTASRRRLGIPDGDLGDQVRDLFRLDQEQHMDEKGEFRPIVLPEDSEDLERRNLILIRAYREIWSKARGVQKERLGLDEQHRQPENQLRQQEYQRQAALQQAAQQNLQRGQMEQVRDLHQQQQQQQQHMLNSQAMFINQQQPQMANQARLGQPQAQARQAQPGQQQQINPQWAQGRTQAALASHDRRPSLELHQQMAQPAGQLGQRPQSSGAFPGAGNAAISQNSFAPQNVGPQFSQLSSNLVLSSASPTSPTVSSAAQAQYQYNMPLQQQTTQSTYGQNLMRWFASPPSPTLVQSPQTPTMRTANAPVSPHMGGQQSWSRPQSGAAMQSQTVQPQVMQRQMSQHQMAQQQWAQQQHLVQQQQLAKQQILRQQMRQQQLRQQSIQPQLGQPHVGQWMAQQTVQIKTPIIPHRGHVIDRSEYPHSHQEKKSLLMSLHQAQARSPDRTRCNGGTDERYYQFVRSLAVEPLRLVYYHEVNFEVSTEQYSRLCKPKTLPQLGGGNPNQTRTPLLVREYGDDSLRFRVRCCRFRSEKLPVQESDWVTKNMSWPDHIFVHVNEHKLTIRRGTHNGKDLPIELTDFLHAGSNKLKVAVPRADPTAADKEGIFFLAIEVIEISSHTALLRSVESNNRVDREETLNKIRIRVNAAPDEDDEIAVIDRTGSTARELSISLTDPFSTSIFRTPARGATCSHLECFDLETWLTTRPAKQQIKCGHKDVCTCTKRLEPTEPDKWKCPICFEDARPTSLRIDTFLEGVRKQLEERNQLDVKSILVAADGIWRPVEEPEDDDDEGSDGDGPVSAKRRSTSALRRSMPEERGRAPAEVIELD